MKTKMKPVTIGDTTLRVGFVVCSKSMTKERPRACGVLRAAALVVLCGYGQGFSLHGGPALRLGSGGVLGGPRMLKQQRTMRTLPSAGAVRMSSGATGGSDYLSSLSKTIDRSDAAKTFPPVSPSAAIRTDGLAVMSLTVGIPKEVRGRACVRSKNMCVVGMNLSSASLLEGFSLCPLATNMCGYLNFTAGDSG